MGSSGKSKRTGTNRKGTKLHKRSARSKFRGRHIDQVWEDARKMSTDLVHDGVTGPLGTMDKVKLDEDLPARGQFYCITCARYFISESAMSSHVKTKAHKRKLKELEGPKPHNQIDADLAGCMGRPDNGELC